MSLFLSVSSSGRLRSRIFQLISLLYVHVFYTIANLNLRTESSGAGVTGVSPTPRDSRARVRGRRNSARAPHYLYCEALRRTQAGDLYENGVYLYQRVTAERG